MKLVQNHGNYFFRFPRDDFWTKVIVKDYEFCKFISGKTDFKTVLLELLYDNGRPFSKHKKIEGIPLADKMNTLSKEEINTVSLEISKFMYQMHSIKFNKDKIFTINNIGLKLTDFINDIFECHINKDDMTFWNYNNFINKPHNNLVHGDLNSSNIILDNNNHVAGIIDFGFGGFGNPYFDIARIIGRCPENFKEFFIKSYEEFSGRSLDYKVLDEEIDLWNKIDNTYINYMKKIGIYK